ncbi:RTA1-like protein [Panaeolus papilionaceus]|nr:RTA1-like protein [Panaeolus papilionaceus]
MGASKSKAVYLCLLLFTFVSAVASVDIPVNLPTDPFADPKNDLRNPLRYIPSKTLAAIAIVIYMLVFISQCWCFKKWGGKFMLIMTCGIFTFCVGLSLRFPFGRNPHNLPLYIVHDLFILLSPCAFIATTYMLLGRMALSLNSERHLLIRRQWITKIFVTSDVVTFLIQAVGGSLPAIDDGLLDLGHSIFLIGIVIQLVSFFVYTILFVVFTWKLYHLESDVWRKDRHKKWYNRWQALPMALGVSCIGILIRSAFRVAEGVGGFDSGLRTSEPHFYALDVLPLFFAISIYIPFWPGRFIASQQSHEPVHYPLDWKDDNDQPNEGKGFELSRPKRGYNQVAE